MGVPTWLSSDPIEAKPQPRTRPGWSPRPRNRVKILNAWDIPEGIGSGADDNPPMFLNPATGNYEPLQSLVMPAGETLQLQNGQPPVSQVADASPETPGGDVSAAATPVDTGVTMPSLTVGTPSVIPSSRSAASTAAGSSAGTGRSVLPSSSPTQSRAGIATSGASAPPPQGSSSAPAAGSRQQQFLAQAVPAAKAASTKTGIPWQVYVGISANETGWGSSVVGNNYFGIKGSNVNTGANTGAVGTWEVVNGQRVNIKDTFRAYSSPEESFEDFGNFIKANPRYAPALAYLKKNPDDWRGFAHMLNDEGYATDPDWATKVVSIGNGVPDDGKPAPPPSKVGADASGVKGVQSVIDYGSQAIGSKYQWGGPGGRSDFGDQFAGSDCSGFVAWAYHNATGVSLTPQTSGMWKETTEIPADQAMPGDLVFYNHGQGADMEHVGIYAGHGMMLHDSSLNPNGGVDITPVWDKPTYRRVTGVDPSLVDDRQPNSLVTADGSASPIQQPSVQTAMTSPSLWEDWSETVQNGRKLWTGHTHDGQSAKHDFGPAPEGMADGTVIGAGQEEDDGDDEEDDTDYSYLDTPLSPQGEAAFQIWKAKYAPRDSGFDYDLRGAFAAGVKPDPETGHWPDTYKKPNHPTFSDQSKWAKDYPDKAGHWDGDTYMKPSFLNPSTGDYDPLKSGVGAGADGDDEGTWVDANGNPVSQATVNQAALTAQRHGEQNAGYQPQIDTPGGGYNVPTNATVTNMGGPDVVNEATGTALAPPPAPDPDLQRHLGGTPAPPVVPSLATPTTPAAPAAPQAPSVGQSIDTAISQASSAIDDAASKGAVGDLLNKTAAGAIGAASNTLGTLAGQAGGAVRNASQTLQQQWDQRTPPPAPQIVPDESQQQPPPQARTAAEVAGTSVSDLTSQAPQAAQAAQDIAQTAQDLNTVQPGTAAVQAVTPAVQDVSQNIQNASDWYDKNAAPVVNPVADQLRGGPGAALVRMAPGIGAAADFMRRNGYDWKPVQDKLDVVLDPDNPANPLSPNNPLAAAAAQQNTSTGPKQLQDQGVFTAAASAQAAMLAMDAYNKLNDVRVEMVRQSQPPEMRDTPEGQMAQQAIAIASDPTMYVGTPLLSRGKYLIDGTEAAAKLIPRATEEAATRAAEAAVPTAAQDLIKLAGPVDQRATRDVLQRAALEFNDPALNVAEQVGRYEPLSGEQIRRTLMGSAATADPKAPLTTLMERVDNLLLKSGLPDLTTDRAAMFASKIPQTVQDARAAWLKLPAQQAAQEFERNWGKTLALSEAGGARTAAAMRLGGGAAAGLAWAKTTEDPNDPYYDSKVLAKTAGVAAAAVGVPYASGLFKKYAPAVTRAGSAFFAPTENLGKSGMAQSAIQTWEGEHRLGGALGDMFTQRTRAIFGKNMDTDMAAYIERTGQLPAPYAFDKAAQDWLADWKAITKWAVQYDIVPGDVTASKAAGAPVQYVPHVLEEGYKEALKLGRADAQRGRITGNPFSQYTKPRSFPTLDAGRAAATPIEYAKDYTQVFGDYYDRAIQMQARQNLANELRAVGQANKMSGYGSGLLSSVLKDLDVAHQDIPDTVKDTRNLADFFGGRLPNPIRPDEKIMGSPELTTVLENLFGSGRQGLIGKLNLPENLMYATSDINGFLKHNTLSGSGFHLINELRQFVGANGLNAVMPNQWKNFAKMTTPGGARAFWSDPVTRATAERAIRNGLTLDLSADRPLQDATHRALSAVYNTAGGALTGYASAGGTGANQQDQTNAALKGGAIGLAASLPIAGLGRATPIEALSHLMWDRLIPYMKYTTFSMYDAAQGGRNPRAVASFVNALFGGNNALAVARSQSTTDLTRLIALAPDWQESWARLVGNAAFGWGANAPVGDMARKYWVNTAMQSAMGLEMANYIFNGKMSWQNDPDAWGLVGMTKFYDDHGLPHTNPNGETYTPYWDMLGPLRGMLEPLQQSARWASAQAIEKAGYKPGLMSVAPDAAKLLYGKFGDQPQPDPATSWKSFFGSRSSMVLSTPPEIFGDKDFAGRSYSDPGDPSWKIALGQLSRVMQHAEPTGVTSYLQNTTRGDPAGLAALSAVTGMRIRHESETNKYFDFLDEYVNKYGSGTDKYQSRVDDARNAATRIDQRIEALQSGADRVEMEDGRVLSPASMTARQRSDLIDNLVQERGATRVRSILHDITPTDRTLSPEDQANQRAQLDWLSHQNPVEGGNDPADLFAGRNDLDPDEIYRLAWNRDPTQLQSVAGTLPKPTDPLGEFGAQALDVLGHGVRQTPAKVTADLRNRWMTDTAATWGLDRDSLEDWVKAKTYGLDSPPLLPGVTSKQLDAVVNGYEDAGRNLPEKSSSDAAVIARTNYLQEQAAALGVPYQDLANRVRLRTVPLTDQTDAGKSRFNALTVQSNSKAYPYTNPDGTPYQGVTDPSMWKQWDNKLAANTDRRASNGVYLTKDKKAQDAELTGLAKAKQEGTASRYVEVYNDKARRDDYYRWFGDGMNMTDDQWAKYQAGTLPMYNDHPSPQEQLQRREFIRIAQAKTPQERLDYTDPAKGKPLINWMADYGDGRGPHVESGPLLAYLSYIKHHTSNQYLDISPGAFDGVE